MKHKSCNIITFYKFSVTERMLYLTTEDVLNAYCQQYDFDWDIIGEYVRIRSKRDTWLVLNRDHEGRKLKLRHMNAYDSGGSHFQCTCSGLRKLFDYISKHDNKEMFMSNKTDRIYNHLKELNLM